MFKKKNIILILGALLFASLSNATIVKETRQDEDIKFFTNQGGIIKSDAAIDGATGRLKIKEITNEAGSGAPSFPFGASGITAEISDFKVSSVSDPSATVGGGFYILPDGREIGTYSGSGTTSGSYGVDLSIDLDAMLGVNPADATLYTLAIDLDACCNDPIKLDVLSDSKRSVYPVTQSELAILLGSPTDLDMRRYVPVSYIRSADSGTSWSGTGSAFGGFASKNHPRPNVNANPIVYTKSRSIGTVGSVANEQGTLVDADFPNPGNVAAFSFKGNINKTAGTATASFTATGSPNFDGKGMFGSENILRFSGVEYLESTDSFFKPAAGTAYSMGIVVDVVHDENASSHAYISSWDGGNSQWLVRRNAVDEIEVFNAGALVGSVAVSEGIHTIAVTYNPTGTVTNVYVDGKNIANNILATVTPLSNLRIGQRGTGNDPMRGTVEEFFFVNGDALTASEVNHIYSKRFSNHKQIAGGHVLTKDSLPFENVDNRYAFWDMSSVNDISGATSCSAGSSACNFTNAGGAVFTGNDLFGEVGSLKLDGVDDVLTLVDDYVNPSDKTPRTFAAWFVADSEVTGILASSSINGALSGSSWELKRISGKLAFFVTNGTISDDSKFSINTHGTWFHVAATYDGTGGWVIYVDGVKVHEVSMFPNQLATALLSIGARNTAANVFFEGRSKGMVYTNTKLTAEDIKKLASSKITTGLSLPIANQDFSKSLWTREDGKINNQLIPDWIVDNSSTDIYVDLGLPSGSVLDLKIVDTSFNGSVIATKELDTGNLSASPTFPMPHGLPGTPGSFYILTESQTLPGEWDERHDLCSVDDTHITCNLSSLVIDVTHRVRVFAGMAPGGVAVQQGVDSLGPRSIGSVGSVANAQGALVDGDFTTIATSTYYGLDGNANKTGGTLGDAVLTKQDTTDPVFSSKGFFGRENVVTFTRSNDDRLSSTDSFFNPGDTTDWSMFSWVYMDWESPTSGGQYPISQWPTTGSDKIGWSFNVIPDGTSLKFQTTTGGTGVEITSVSTSGMGVAWHHIGITYNSTTNTFNAWVDGNNIGSTVQIAQSPSPNQLVLGGLLSVTDGNDCDCSIQDFSFEHRELSNVEVNARYSKRFTNHQQIAAGHVLTNDSFPFASLSGRVSYWNLNSTSLLTDGSGNGKSLTNNGVIQFVGLGIFGQSDIAVFDGVDDYFSILDSDYFSAVNKTFGGWFNPGESGSGNVIISKYTDAGSQREYLLYVGPSDKYTCITSTDGSATELVVSNTLASTGVWAHVVCSTGNGMLSMYVNGILENKVPYTTTFASSSDVNIGAFNAGTSLKKARMSSIFFSPRTLSDEDIHKLYSAKITHSKNVDPKLQSWRTSYQREDGYFNVQLENGWQTSLHLNDIYVDFSDMPSGSVVTTIYQ